MDKDISDYINKQRSPQREICQKLRRLILKALPGAKEEMKWGVPVFASGKFYISALNDHINLGFFVNGLTKKEAGFFEGWGKSMRRIKIGASEEIDKEKPVKLFKMVFKKSKCKEC